jgi:hypothetical protein
MRHVIFFLFLSCFLMTVDLYAQNTAVNTNDHGFFPIAVWLQSPSNAASYKANGINLFIGVHNGLNQTKLNQFKAANMKFICSQNEFSKNHLHEPLIYGWMHDDEPDNAQWNSVTRKYDPCIDPEIIINDYLEIKETDPSRPVYLNLGRGVAVTDWIGRGTCTGDTNMYKVSANGYLKGCDIASFDVYPVNSTEKHVQDSLWYIARGIDNLKKWSDYEKPIWCWIETTRISEESERKPTPAEVKSEVWMALIHGAKGFGYFCHSFYPSFVEAGLLQDQEMIKAVKAINEQVTSLAEVLNSPDISGIAQVSSSNSFVPVDIMTKNYNNANYIFAVAMKPGQTKATFNIGEIEGEEVEVLGENRRITVTGGEFTDDFSDYEVHLYKWNTTATNRTELESRPNAFPKIFPNPTFGKLHILFSSVFNGKIMLSDNTGKIVLEKKIFSKECSIDLSDLNNGIYFIKTGTGVNYWHKVIKY